MPIPLSNIEDFASKLTKYNISLAQYKESLCEDEISSKLVIHFIHYIYVAYMIKYFRRKHDHNDNDDNDTRHKLAKAN